MAPDRILTVNQAAKQVDCSTFTIFRAIKAKRLRAYRDADGHGRYGIFQADLTAWREARKKWNVPLDWDLPKE